MQRCAATPAILIAPCWGSRAAAITCGMAELRAAGNQRPVTYTTAANSVGVRSSGAWGAAATSRANSSWAVSPARANASAASPSSKAPPPVASRPRRGLRASPPRPAAVSEAREPGQDNVERRCHCELFDVEARTRKPHAPFGRGVHHP